MFCIFPCKRDRRLNCERMFNWVHGFNCRVCVCVFWEESNNLPVAEEELRRGQPRGLLAHLCGEVEALDDGQDRGHAEAGRAFLHVPVQNPAVAPPQHGVHPACNSHGSRHEWTRGGWWEKRLFCRYSLHLASDHSCAGAAAAMTWLGVIVVLAATATVATATTTSRPSVSGRGRTPGLSRQRIGVVCETFLNNSSGRLLRCGCLLARAGLANRSTSAQETVPAPWRQASALAFWRAQNRLVRYVTSCSPAERRVGSDWASGICGRLASRLPSKLSLPFTYDWPCGHVWPWGAHLAVTCLVTRVEAAVKCDPATATCYIVVARALGRISPVSAVSVPSGSLHAPAGHLYNITLLKCVRSPIVATRFVGTSAACVVLQTFLRIYFHPISLIYFVSPPSIPAELRNARLLNGRAYSESRSFIEAFTRQWKLSLTKLFLQEHSVPTKTELTIFLNSLPEKRTPKSTTDVN